MVSVGDGVHGIRVSANANANSHLHIDDSVIIVKPIDRNVAANVGTTFKSVVAVAASALAKSYAHSSIGGDDDVAGVVVKHSDADAAAQISVQSSGVHSEIVAASASAHLHQDDSCNGVPHVNENIAAANANVREINGQKGVVSTASASAQSIVHDDDACGCSSSLPGIGHLLGGKSILGLGSLL